MSRKIESFSSHKGLNILLLCLKINKVINIFKYLIIFLTLDDTKEFEKIKLHQQLFKINRVLIFSYTF